MIYLDRIPYNTWINSQLSVAKHYGGIVIQGEQYVLDYDGCKTEMINGEIRYFPDLAKEKTIIKPKKSKMKSVSLF